MVAAATAAVLTALSPLYAGAAPSSVVDLQAPVADGPVRAIAHAPNGLTYIGGEFSHVGPRAGRGVPLVSPTVEPEGNGISLVEGPAPGASNFPEVSGGEVKAVEPDGAGGWFIGGDFTAVGGASWPRLAHITSAGELDTSWKPAPNGPVNALSLAEPTTVSPSRVLYVGGDFRGIAGNSNLLFLAAFNVNGDGAAGSLTSWNPGQSDGGGAIYDLETVSVTLPVTDGSGTSNRSMSLVMVAGDYDKLAGNTASAGIGAAPVWGVGALKPNGTSSAGLAEAAWDPDFTDPVRAVEISPRANPDTAGKITYAIYLGGDFPANATSNGRNVRAYQLQVDQVTGAVATDASLSESGWWTGAVKDPATVATTVRALELSPGGETLYVGGKFSKIGPASTSRQSLAALTAIPLNQITTPSCTTTCPATPVAFAPDPNGTVNGLLRAEGKLLVAGDFSRISGQARAGLAALSAGDGSAFGWNPRLAGGAVNAVAADSNSVYAGGAFSAVGALSRSNIAAIDSQGGVTGLFATGATCDDSVHPCSTGEVSALALSPDASRLFVGGGFTHLEGQKQIHLAAADAQTGLVIPGWAPDPDYYDRSGNARGKGWVLALEGAGNTLYAGGAFNRIGGVARASIAAIDMTSGAVHGWQPDAACSDPATCNVYALEASCGSVYAGGNFNAIGGRVRNYLAAVEAVGTPGAGQATPWAPEANGVVYSLARSGSTVYAGGLFTVVGGEVRPRLAALDAGTSRAVPNWNPAPEPEVRAIDLSEDARTLYAGGLFSEIGGANRSSLAAIEAVGVGTGRGLALAWTPAPAGPMADKDAAFPGTYAIDAVGDSVYAGGEFREVGSRAQSGFAAFTSGPDPALGEPERCAHEGPKVSVPVAPVAPVAEVPRITDVRLTEKLQLIYRLSMPARVEIDLERKVRGYELPAPKPTAARDSRAGGDERPTVCKSPTARNRRAAIRVVEKDLGRRAKRLSDKKRKALVRKHLRKLRCPTFKQVDERSHQGEQGPNEVSLKDGKEGLPKASYRVTLLPITQASGPGAPAALDFRVLRSGAAETAETDDKDWGAK